ncbi:MAG: hypothetical protein IPK16_30295 [Anaerolineales bacterium]|nr:hypothetical protein [Anaerolineales bacterium]
MVNGIGARSTTTFADRLPMFDYEKIYLDGTSALSPDGETLAVLMTSFDEMHASERSLWTIDLTDAIQAADARGC